MPVPVASTHYKGAGLEAVKFEQMDTTGPFARLKDTSTKSGDQPTESAPEPAPPATNDSHAASQPCNDVPAFQHALETCDLCFKYPGIGNMCLLTLETSCSDAAVNLIC